MKSIKIAPSVDEISLENEILSTCFNNMIITFKLKEGMSFKFNKEYLVFCFQSSIALASKTHHIMNFMNMNGIEGTLEVTSK